MKRDTPGFIRRLYGIFQEGALLLLIRHGETTWNAENRVQGQSDSPLSEVGIAQARALADRLKDEPIAAAYSSDLSRAFETAKIIAEPHGLGVIASHTLREADYGEWTGRTMDEVRADWSEAYADYVSDPANARIPGGESVLELVRRSHTCAVEIAQRHPGENILIVGHGGSVRGIICGILDRVELFWNFKLSNAGLTVIEWKETGPRVIALNDVCHLIGAQPGAVGANGEEC